MNDDADDWFDFMNKLAETWPLKLKDGKLPKLSEDDYNVQWSDYPADAVDTSSSSPWVYLSNSDWNSLNGTMDAMNDNALSDNDLLNNNNISPETFIGDHNAQGIQQPRQEPQPAHNVSDKRKDEGSSCNCKKSKCLKFYCGCFGSGFFCGNSCLCSDCHNNEDYEDTVEDECEKKKLQNPNAFDSKLVSLSETNNGTTTRHRKGCNCTNSKCEKKYCDCYRADVGCFEKCRCQDCKNPYNRKSDTNEMNNNGHSTFGTGSQQNVSCEPASTSASNGGDNLNGTYSDQQQFENGLPE